MCSPLVEQRIGACGVLMPDEEVAGESSDDDSESLALTIAS
jgi:hypothetical protein